MHGEQYTKFISSLSERDLHCVYGMACTCAPVSCPACIATPPSEKWSGEQSRISWDHSCVHSYLLYRHSKIMHLCMI